MPHNFWTLLTAKTRRLGYAPRRTDGLVRFVVTCMALMFAAMDIVAVPGLALWELTDSPGNTAAEPFDVTVLPAAYSIHRQPPA